jgi:asparagine synthase (glutamine-hydrolysing)
MSYGRELRVPFLDHKFVNFMFKVPSKFKIHKGRQKDLLIESLHDDLPSSTYLISKNALLREKLNSKLHKIMINASLDILNTDKARERGLYDPSVYIDKSKMDKDFIGIYWKMSQIELWHQLFIDEIIFDPLIFPDE